INQKVVVKNNDLIDTLNVKYSNNHSFDTNIFYSKRYMTIFNNEIYFGLFNRNKFVSFVNVDELDLGKVDGVAFKFKSQTTKIYMSPDLKNPIKLKSNTKSLEANSYFNLNDTEIIGFTFNENTYLVNISDVNIQSEINRLPDKYNKQELSKEYYMNCSRADKTEYYNNNKNFDTTKKLKNIISKINNLEMENRLYKPFNVKIGI